VARPYNKILKQLRRRGGFPQADVAAHLMLTQGTMSRIETGSQALTVDQLITILELYGGVLRIQHPKLTLLQKWNRVERVKRSA